MTMKVECLRLGNNWRRLAGQLDQQAAEATNVLEKAELQAKCRTLLACAEEITQLFQQSQEDNEATHLTRTVLVGGQAG